MVVLVAFIMTWAAPGVDREFTELFPYQGGGAGKWAEPSGMYPESLSALADAPVASLVAAGADGTVALEHIRSIATEALAREGTLAGKRLLLIVPDGTRTAPVGPVFRAVHEIAAEAGASAVDVMIALGTHQPMSEEGICRRLEISGEERATRYAAVRLFNHAWDDPAQLTPLGVIPANEIAALTDGRFAQDVPVSITRRVLEYDRLIIIGPVFPHEVVGFSGGNKYLFPGVGGPDVLNFFHWLGANLTSPRIMGHKWTPVRAVVDRSASLVPVPRTTFCLVVRPGDGALAGLYAGPTEAAWSRASDHAAQLHITTVARPFHTILACSPPMYDEVWTAGKCMYKLEPVLADGGELIIYAPHIREFSVTHGAAIRRVGYHTRDYFLAQWERFQHEPWGVLAHSTHVRGIGTYVDGVEHPRVTVTLASQIPEAACRAVSLGYRDPSTVDPSAFASREDHGVLLVPKAGEMLYRLADPPEWARP
jgi:nickel-dependent lactate racemase